MAEDTGVEWADHSFNFWAGCQKVSPACDFCYAERETDRYGYVKWGPKAPRRRTADSTWKKLPSLNRKAVHFIKEHGRKPIVFCNSWSDFFDNHKTIDPAWRADALQLMVDCPNLFFTITTKRPQNIRKMVPAAWIEAGEWPSNIGIIVTVENQEEANRRLPIFLSIPNIPMRGVSCEPLLGPISLDKLKVDNWPISLIYDALRDFFIDADLYHYGLDWVITGGETGPQARPSHPSWFTDLQGQCWATDTPFFFKQWGEWGDGVSGDGEVYSPMIAQDSVRCALMSPDGGYNIYENGMAAPSGKPVVDYLYRLGKRKTGDVLNAGRYHGLPDAVKISEGDKIE